jgi:hypothetical protein
MAILTTVIVGGTTFVVKKLIKNKMEAKEFEPFCGKRPFFVGKERKAWDLCVENLPDEIEVQERVPNAPPQRVPNAPPQNNTQIFKPKPTNNKQKNIVSSSANGEQTFLQKYKTPLLIGGGLILVFTIYKISKRK